MTPRNIISSNKAACNNLGVERLEGREAHLGGISMKTARHAGARSSAPVAVGILCVLVSTVPPSRAPLHAADGRQAISSIAKVLLDFTHVPTVSQKATLQGILDNDTTTVAERVLAQVLLNVEHVPHPDDKPKLEALVRNNSSPPAVKTLATILRNFSHAPTDVDKKNLRELLRQVCQGRNESAPRLNP
jgi:hypothetical protein